MSKAIIVGGSISGLTAAKSLTSHFDEVEIIEPDFISGEGQPRKGVPQGNHVHGLLKGGGDALTALFPNLPARLQLEGAVVANFSREVRWYLNKRWLPRFDGSLSIYFQTRPLLEKCLREEVELLGNVTITTNCRVTDFTLNAERNRIVGIVVEDENGDTRALNADFFVDAMGRGSFLPKWLKKEGIGDVRESRVKVGLGYASCLFELPEDESRDWKSLLVYPKGPDEIRGATLVNVENNQWLLTLAGYHGIHAPSDIGGFLEFASKLPKPEIFEAIKDATPLSEIKLHKFPYGLQRYYGELDKFPLALIPVGDSNASLNPLFGQGMSAGALSSLSLATLLEKTGKIDEEELKILKSAYFKSLVEIYKTPWDLALGQDFRYPLTEGTAPAGLRIMNFFKDLVIGSSSPEILEKFFKVVHLVEKQSCFYNPVSILKILTSQKQ